MNCPFFNDGVCDEPEGTGRCFEGEDFNDCSPMNGCMLANDGVCDEPEGTGSCAEGTDFNDCAGCSRANDGVCDEPEGTGQCADGSDVSDCAASEVVCGSTLCSVLDPSGLGLLDACCTLNATCGVSSPTGCVPIEEAQEGVCEPYETPVASVALAACCLPSGVCGLELPDGCVSLVVAPVLDLSAVPCDADQDAGVE
jgi:hypothetical protein